MAFAENEGAIICAILSEKISKLISIGINKKSNCVVNRKANWFAYKSPLFLLSFINTGKKLTPNEMPTAEVIKVKRPKTKKNISASCVVPK